MAPKKHYTPLQMGMAIDAVRKGEKIATAATTFGVPRITLYNKVSGKSPIDCPMGPKTILTKSEEDILEKWLIAMSARHFPVNREILLESVQKIVTEQGRANPFTNNKPGKKWFRSFLKRHPDITEKTAQNLTKSRDDVAEEDIRKWFDEIKLYLEERGLKYILDEPNRIFNTDESAFFLSPKAGRVLCRRGEKHLYNFCGDERDNLTVLITANAAGQLAPPMVVFKYERVPSHISATVPDNWGIGKSESGWMCGNGHKSHLTLHVSNYCSANGIEVIALYPNATHILQPMDLAVFRPLKVAWRKEVSKWQLDHLGQNLKKEHFAPVLQNALSSLSEDCIRNGFRAGGLHPFGSDYIDMTKIKKHLVTHKEMDPKQTDFFNYLESEIVKVYSRQKLELFNKLYYKERNILEKSLPAEDEALYVIWAKNKQEVLKSQRTIVLQSTDADPATSCIDKVVATNPDIDEPVADTDENVCPQNINHILSVELETLVKDTNHTENNQLENSHLNSISTIEKPADLTQEQIESPTFEEALLEAEKLYAETDFFQNTSSVLEMCDSDRGKQLNKVTSEFEQICSRLAKSPTDVDHVESKRQQSVPTPTPLRISKHIEDIEHVPVNTLAAEINLSCSLAPTGTPQKHSLEATLGIVIPSPFKKNLFWPEEIKKKKRYTKEKIPYAVTSKAWQQYHIRKEAEKQKKQEEKDKRAKERQEKKILKEMNMKNKKNQRSKFKKTVKDHEDTSSEDTDIEITYAESEDSDLNEDDEDSMKENEKRQAVTQSKRRQSCSSMQRTKQTKRRRQDQRCKSIIYSNSDDEKPISMLKVTKKSDLTVNTEQYVIVKYEGEYFPGKIEDVDKDQYEISTMTLSTGNSFRWPEKPDKIWYKAEDVVEVISGPVPLNKRGFYRVKEMLKYLPDIIYNI